MSTTASKTLYILRGISGSGKSTLAKKIIEEEVGSESNENTTYVFSTDDYFINKNTGVYEFNGAKIGAAHVWNQNRVKKAMGESQNLILVDNTNTQRWEAKPYVVMAQEFGYNIVVREPDTPWKRDAQELAKRNLHGVPVEAIQRMLDRWDEDFSVGAILRSSPPNFAKRSNNRRPPQNK